MKRENPECNTPGKSYVKLLKLGHRGYGSKEKNNKTEERGYP